MTVDWAGAVAAAAPSLVLPPGDRRAAVEVAGPLALLSLLPLDDVRGVAVVRDGSGARWTVPLVADGDGLRRAVPGDGVAESLVSRLAGGDAPGFRVRSYGGRAVRGERGLDVDQTNETVVVGEAAAVKWVVRLPGEGEPGSPAAQRISALAEAGFDGMPQPWGLVELDEPGLPLVASVVAFLPGALDGWDWAVDDVRRLARGEISDDEALEPARVLGGLTARMHVGLAAKGVDQTDVDQLRAWADRARAELQEALARVEGDEGERLRGWAPRIAAAYDVLDGIDATPVIDVHGDLHVGQALRHDGGYAITDFDGNPLADADERSGRRPAAVDVVGMTASLDHVGRVVLFRSPGVDEDVVHRWIDAAQDSFLAEYRAGLAAAGRSELLDYRLLAPLRLAQEVHEHVYAVTHLPHWVYVPDMALAHLLAEDA